MPDFRPKPLDGYIPTPADMDYADRFALVEAFVFGLRHSELATLRLSTCRNIYMTINAMFVDIAMMLGHGATSSKLATAVAITKLTRPTSTDRAALHSALNAVRATLAAFAKKARVWADRHELDTEISEALRTLTPSKQGRLYSVLYNVRTSAPLDQHVARWDARWYELSDTDTTRTREQLALLLAVRTLIEAIVDIVRSIERYCNEAADGDGSLFRSESQAQLVLQWKAIVTQIRDLVSSAELGTVRAIPNSVPACSVAEYDVWDSANSTYERTAARIEICDYLDSVLNVIRPRLLNAFPPNIPHTALPKPYVIDLSEELSAMSSGTILLRPHVAEHDFRCTRPDTIGVALLHTQFPRASLIEHSLQYRDATVLDRIEQLVGGAIASVRRHCEGPSVLVLPELLLPVKSRNAIEALASSNNVSLIGGVEGVYTKKLIGLNRCVVVMPFARCSLEYVKVCSSVYERKGTYQSAAIPVMFNTDIGSFAVVICNTFMEWEVLDQVAHASGPIDVLFVLSHIPYDTLFEMMARTDSVRLYCHVVLATSSPTGHDGSTIDVGGTVWSPIRSDTDCRRRPETEIPLDGGSVSLFELSLKDITSGRDEGKPATGYFNCPVSRLSEGLTEF